MMLVTAEVYSAGARVRGHLQRVIQACSSATACFGLVFYDSRISIGFNSVLHCFLDEIRPSVPIALVAGARQPAMSSCVSTNDVVSTQTSVLHTERRQSECTYRLEQQIAIVS